MKKDKKIKLGKLNFYIIDDNYINQPNNKEKIIEKAQKIYNYVIKENTKSKTALFYKQISCNFKILEEKCKEYIMFS